MVDDAPERKARARGPADPTGHVSSGLQPGPLRGSDPRPGARGRDGPVEDVVEPYRTGTSDAETDEGASR